MANLNLLLRNILKCNRPATHTEFICICADFSPFKSEKNTECRRDSFMFSLFIQIVLPWMFCMNGFLQSRDVILWNTKGLHE